MSRLTKKQKLAKRWKRYAEALAELDLKVYGQRVDKNGEYHASYRGFPHGYPHTQAYGRKQRRNRK